EQMQELERSSIDFYSMMRSVVQQKREAELREALKESALSVLPWLAPPADEASALGSPALQPSPASIVIEPSPASSPDADPAPPRPPQQPPAPSLKSAPSLISSRPRSQTPDRSSSEGPGLYEWSPETIRPQRPMGLGFATE